jgi:hypothetical protein
LCSPALREEHRLRVFKNRVPRIFEPMRGEIKGERKKLHSWELHNMYPSPNIIRADKSRRMRWARHVTHGRGEESV